MNIQASSKKYALASAFVVLMTLVIDQIFFQQIVELATAKPQVPTLRKPEAKVKVASKMTQMSLVNIELPLPPSVHEIQAPTQTIVQNHVPLKSESDATQPAIEPPVNFVKAQKSFKPRPFGDKLKTPNQLQITHRINQLAALKGIDRTLYFPETSTQQILTYMHNCVGIDLGAVKKNNLTLFSHKNNSHSQIVRAANGFLTPHEQALLAAYAPNQVLVRLYPKWFDERLGKAIDASLGKQAMTQLSGHYALRGKNLWLTKVKLNHKSLEQDWLLSQGC